MKLWFNCGIINQYWSTISISLRISITSFKTNTIQSFKIKIKLLSLWKKSLSRLKMLSILLNLKICYLNAKKNKLHKSYPKKKKSQKLTQAWNHPELYNNPKSPIMNILKENLQIQSIAGMMLKKISSLNGKINLTSRNNP